MPKHLVTAIGLIISLGVIALGFFLVAMPLFLQSVSVDAQTATVASTNSIYQQQVDHLTAEKENLDAITASVEALRTQIPARSQNDDVFEVIGRAASSSGISLVSVTAGERASFDPRKVETSAPADADTTGGTDGTEGAGSVPGAGSSSAAGRQQVDFRISATAESIDQVTAFLDALRAGPRLLSSVTAATSQTGQGIFNVDVSVLSYLDER